MQARESEKMRTVAWAGTAMRAATRAHISARKLFPLHFRYDPKATGSKPRSEESYITAE
jgi:hypothetical protein